MIFLELIFFLTLSFFSIYSLAGLGQLILYQKEKYFFESFFFGFIAATFIVTLLHFFTKINNYIILVVFIFGFYNAIKKFKFVKENYKKILIYFIIFLIFVPIFLSQKFHEDFGYYHLPYVINLFNEKIIFGMANVNSAFIHNSIWLNLYSLFYFNDNFNFLTLPTFLLFVLFILFSLNNIFESKNFTVSNYFLIVSIFYLILKFTRISEYGTDLPATLFSLLSIYYFLKYFELTKTEIKNLYFYIIFCFTVFSILIKFSSIPLIILVIFIFLKDYKILRNEIFKLKYNFIYSFGLLFLVQQFIYSGCLIFPSELSCFKVSWLNDESLAWKNKIELINKSFSSTNNEITKENYLTNFNWVPYWFKRNYMEISEHLLTMLIPLLIFLTFLKKDFKKFQNNKSFLILITFILSGLVFWFIFSPVLRFSVPYLVSLIFLITFHIYIKKKFSKKIFVIFLSLIIIFNLSKNINRILKIDNIYFGIDKVDNKYIQLSNINSKSLNVYMPDIKKNYQNGWQGRLCWDIPFLCTYNEIGISKKYGYYFVNKLNKLK